MWLLNTSTAELKFFHNPSRIKYAILSHVWREGQEQSFQDLQTLRVQTVSHNDSPRSRASNKIRECCIYAERGGYEWVWIDTCCIDKASSAELSEAINSMYAWYAHAEVCYAYLDDVRDKENPGAFRSSFRRSRWWTRGWTLQELIAPKLVIFLSKSWRFIGTKHSLAQVVEEISGVERAILIHQRALDDVSVARRMSWASRRETTREEDRAYSLMGIFGVNMPTIYGEGARAFLRLQEEILKHIPDQTIFAWGAILDNYPFSCKGFASDPKDPGTHSVYTGVSSTDMQTLLAPSPNEFAAAGRIRPVKTTELSHRLGVPMTNPHYLSTSYGIRTQMPIIPYQTAPGVNLTTPANVSVAVLACEHEDQSLVLLFLRRKEATQDEYFVGDFVDVGDTHDVFERAYFRVAFLASAASSIMQAADVRDVYVHNRVRPAMRMMLPHRGFGSPEAVERVNYSFFFPEWVLSKLSREGFKPHVDRPAGDDGLTLELLVLPGLDVSAIFKLTRVTSVAFKCARDEGENFTITIGIGCMCQLTQKRRGFEAFWIDVSHSSLGSIGQTQQRPRWTAVGPAGACTRQHLGHMPVEFSNTRGKLQFTVTPWGGATSGARAAQECNYVVGIDILDHQDGDSHDGTTSPIAQPAAAVLQRAVNTFLSLRHWRR